MIDHKRIPRRAAIRTMGVIGAGAALGGAISPPGTSAAARRSDVLAVIGDRWHSFDYLRTAFTRTLVKEAGASVVFAPAPKAVLVRSVNEEGQEYTTSKYGNQGSSCEACWAYECGRGRVCFMAPGHTIPTLWNPEYVKLQKNALRWLLRQT